MTVCLLLAAGSSSRMGKPKMLLPFNNKTLLQHTIDQVKNSNVEELLVVTGCYHSLLKEILQQQQVNFIENKKWEHGMGASIQTGVNYITDQYPDATTVIILVCDQPYISSALINDLQRKATQTGKGIIASAYNDTIGTPVLFTKKYFCHLSALSGQQGAKMILQNFSIDVATVDFPLGAFDIDTPGDYEKLHSM